MIRLSHVREHGKSGRGDFCFKGSSTSFSGENKLIVGLNSNCCDCSIKKNRKKVVWFWQTDMVEFLIDERKLSMMKLDYIWSHLSTAINSKKLFNALPQGNWLAPSTTLPPKMARGIRRTIQMNTSRCQKFISDSFSKSLSFQITG